jgi:hypothetical protein
MRNISAENVGNLSDLSKQMVFFQSKKKKKEANNDDSCDCNNILDEIATQHIFFNKIAEGVDIEGIKQMILDDPKRTLYSDTQKQKLFVNQNNFNGMSPLHIACFHGHSKIVDLLLQYGADHLKKCGVKFTGL